MIPARDEFRQAHWLKTDGEPYCPHCGNPRCHEMSRERFKCSAKECKPVFTVTSGTAFAWRKLTFKTMLLAIWFAANCAKGKAIFQLSRELEVWRCQLNGDYRSLRIVAGFKPEVPLMMSRLHWIDGAGGMRTAR